MNLLLTLVSETANPNVPIGDAVQDLLGFAIVVIVLAALWLLTNINAKIAATIEGAPKSAVAPTPAAVTPAPTQSVNEGITDEEIVIVSAAVAVLMADEPHRIISVKQSGTTWGLEGRRRHFASHKIR